MTYILDLVLIINVYFIDSIEHCNPIGFSNHISFLIHLKVQENGVNQINPQILHPRGD